MERDPNQGDAALYQRLHALKDTAVQAEARAWFFEHFDAATYAELNERYPRGSTERHLLAEFLGFFEGRGGAGLARAAARRCPLRCSVRAGAGLGQDRPNP